MLIITRGFGYSQRIILRGYGGVVDKFFYGYLSDIDSYQKLTQEEQVIIQKLSDARPGITIIGDALVARLVTETKVYHVALLADMRVVITILEIQGEQPAIGDCLVIGAT